VCVHVCMSLCAILICSIIFLYLERSQHQVGCKFLTMYWFCISTAQIWTPFIQPSIIITHKLSLITTVDPSYNNAHHHQVSHMNSFHAVSGGCDWLTVSLTYLRFFTWKVWNFGTLGHTLCVCLNNELVGKKMCNMPYYMAKENFVDLL